jgi:creatinine amidohydrolase
VGGKKYRTMIWDQLSSPQIEALDKNIPVILPVAAIEQHGPHLPVATDRMIGMHFCQELNNAIGDQILILPVVSVGCSEHHLDFPGTLSVKHKTFLKTLTDILGGVQDQGFKNLIVLNSHGGNQAISQTFVETFGYRHPSVNVVLITWWRIALQALQQISETGPGGTGHAGELETSLMLLIAPHLVQKDKIPQKANLSSYDWANGDMLTGPRVSFYRTMKQMTPTGVFGDASISSRDKGIEITNAVVNALIEIVQDLPRA